MHARISHFVLVILIIFSLSNFAQAQTDGTARKAWLEKYGKAHPTITKEEKERKELQRLLYNELRFINDPIYEVVFEPPPRPKISQARVQITVEDARRLVRERKSKIEHPSPEFNRFHNFLSGDKPAPPVDYGPSHTDTCFYRTGGGRCRSLFGR